MATTKNARDRQKQEQARRRAQRSSAQRRSQRPVPKPPSDLGRAGRECWNHVWKTCPWLDDSHRLVVVRLSELYDERAETRAELKREGRTTTGSTGQVVEHPLLGTLRAMEVAINRVERQLGIAVSQTRAAHVTDDLATEAARNESTGTTLDKVTK